MPTVLSSAVLWKTMPAGKAITDRPLWLTLCFPVMEMRWVRFPPLVCQGKSKLPSCSPPFRSLSQALVHCSVLFAQRPPEPALLTPRVSLDTELEGCRDCLRSRGQAESQKDRARPHSPLPREGEVSAGARGCLGLPWARRSQLEKQGHHLKNVRGMCCVNWSGSIWQWKNGYLAH